MPDGRQFALQVRIGAFILAGLGVFLVIIYLLGAQARYFERKYDLVAEFAEVGGLIEGATVRLAGVQIGRVTKVELPSQPGGKVKVTLTIAKRFSDRIRKDSEARIVTQGLLGDKLVEISVGSPSAPPVPPGEHLAAGEPFDMARVFAEATETLGSVKRLTANLNAAVERVDRSGTLDHINRLASALGGAMERMERAGTLDDLGAAAKSARRITAEVEKGKGLLHAVIYGEPETLRRLDALLRSTEELLAKAQGDGAMSVFLSPESGRAARSLLAAMETLGRGAEKSGGGKGKGEKGEGAEGLLSTLLFDPEYRSVADDLQMVAKNFREVSEKLAHGQGLLGELVRGGRETPLGQAAGDFSVAMANLGAVSERLKAGDGTLGGLLEDPTVYENLAQFLEGAQRSVLLRALIRSTINDGGGSAGSAAKSSGTTATPK